MYFHKYGYAQTSLYVTSCLMAVEMHLFQQIGDTLTKIISLSLE